MFQPADQYVICNLKKYAKNAWFLYVQALFRTFPLEEAITAMHSTSAEISRVKKHTFFAEALERVSAQNSVVASWAMSGILRECFQIDVVHISGKLAGQSIVPVIDQMKIMADKGGLFVPEEEIDVDGHPDVKLGEEPPEMVVAVNVEHDEEEEDFAVPQVVLPVAPVHAPLPAPVPKETKKAKDAREKAERNAESVARHAKVYRPIKDFFPVKPK